MTGEELLARVKANIARKIETETAFDPAPTTFDQALTWHADSIVERMTNEELIVAIGNALGR